MDEALIRAGEGLAEPWGRETQQVGLEHVFLLCKNKHRFYLGLNCIPLKFIS